MSGQTEIETAGIAPAPTDGNAVVAAESPMSPNVRRTGGRGSISAAMPDIPVTETTSEMETTSEQATAPQAFVRTGGRGAISATMPDIPVPDATPETESATPNVAVRTGGRGSMMAQQAANPGSDMEPASAKLGEDADEAPTLGMATSAELPAGAAIDADLVRMNDAAPDALALVTALDGDAAPAEDVPAAKADEDNEDKTPEEIERDKLQGRFSGGDAFTAALMRAVTSMQDGGEQSAKRANLADERRRTEIATALERHVAGVEAEKVAKATASAANGGGGGGGRPSLLGGIGAGIGAVLKGGASVGPAVAGLLGKDQVKAYNRQIDDIDRRVEARNVVVTRNREGFNGLMHASTGLAQGRTELARSVQELNSALETHPPAVEFADKVSAVAGRMGVPATAVHDMIHSGDVADLEIASLRQEASALAADPVMSPLFVAAERRANGLHADGRNFEAAVKSLEADGVDPRAVETMVQSLDKADVPDAKMARPGGTRVDKLSEMLNAMMEAMAESIRNFVNRLASAFGRGQSAP